MWCAALAEGTEERSYYRLPSKALNASHLRNIQAIYGVRPRPRPAAQMLPGPACGWSLHPPCRLCVLCRLLLLLLLLLPGC